MECATDFNDQFKNENNASETPCIETDEVVCQKNNPTCTEIDSDLYYDSLDVCSSSAENDSSTDESKTSTTGSIDGLYFSAEFYGLKTTTLDSNCNVNTTNNQEFLGTKTDDGTIRDETNADEESLSSSLSDISHNSLASDISLSEEVEANKEDKLLCEKDTEITHVKCTPDQQCKDKQETKGIIGSLVSFFIRLNTTEEANDIGKNQNPSKVYSSKISETFPWNESGARAFVSMEKLCTPERGKESKDPDEGLNLELGAGHTRTAKQNTEVLDIICNEESDNGIDDIRKKENLMVMIRELICRIVTTIKLKQPKVKYTILHKNVAFQMLTSLKGLKIAEVLGNVWSVPQ